MIKFKRIFCILFGHKFSLMYNITKWSRKIECKRCGKYFAMNDDCRIVVEWGDGFDELYKSLGFRLHD